jgi:hypothetical protein
MQRREVSHVNHECRSEKRRSVSATDRLGDEMGKQRLVAAKHGELNRVQVLILGLVKDVGEIVGYDRFPDVEADEDVALPDTLLAGCPTVADIARRRGEKAQKLSCARLR